MEWYYAKNGQQAGPVGAEEIRSLRESGQLSDADLVWNESLPDWKPLGSFPELLPEGAPTSPPSAPQATPSASDAPTTAALAPASPSQGAGSIPPGERIPTYLWQSIVVLILCCLPLAIPALVYATKVEPAQVRGDLATARDASDKAKMWCWIAFGVGLAANLAIFFLSFAGGLAEGM